MAVEKIKVPAPFLYILGGNRIQAGAWVARKAKPPPACAEDWSIPVGVIDTAEDIMGLKDGSVVLLVGLWQDRTDWHKIHQALAYKLCEIYTSI